MTTKLSNCFPHIQPTTTHILYTTHTCPALKTKNLPWLTMTSDNCILFFVLFFLVSMEVFALFDYNYVRVLV